MGCNGFWIREVFMRFICQYRILFQDITDSSAGEFFIPLVCKQRILELVVKMIKILIKTFSFFAFIFLCSPAKPKQADNVFPFEFSYYNIDYKQYDCGRHKRHSEA